ncbi:hypothetical protein [Xylophilus sp.]|uniref:hypothetical protein n=1 Tax=Xylophilus sp. TaxID=2653893 RepID=UPI0013B5CFDD|nr:hypothetical protein [Xylophilus sp.]KAF1047148.1 MAG: hypothetical protein GAK38_02029 [Xylophilus sp.]
MATATPSAAAPAAAPASAPATAARKPRAAKTAAAPKKVPAASAAKAEPAKEKATPKDTAGKKLKLVRDSFSIPKSEYAQLDALKARAQQLGQPAKKSEVLRAGIKILAALGDAALLKALAAVPPIKTGRPSAEEAGAGKQKSKG